MNNKDLCLQLMHADNEEEVVALLSDAGYWDDGECWRWLGDNENNFSTVGNQQADAVGALAEKVVNSIDARLVNAALENGVDPEGGDAPKSIREAVARLIENRTGYDPDRDGLIRHWRDGELGKHAELITVAATGAKPRSGKNPCLTIADQGEGQSPSMFPDTFLSLQGSNKLRIPFVQGKFNMGGTGALQFCSPQWNLQLILSRRNPRLVSRDGGSSDRDHEWGFTIVRRKDPIGHVRSSVYEYLAPKRLEVLGARQGEVLSFRADEMPIFPSRDSGKAYGRGSIYGSLVKLYEYKWPGDKSDLTRSSTGRRQGLLKRLESKIADPALPFRLYECRDYKKDAPYHNGIGIVNTVEKRRGDLEFTDGMDLSVDDHRLPTKFYLFKAGEGSEQRRADAGVLYLINGQTHASNSTRFFDRRRVGKSYIKNDLLVTVDCSGFEGRAREDLFMNSRDRLRGSDVATHMEQELERALKENRGLREANSRRRADALRKDMASNETVSKVLRDLFANDRDLARYLIEGGNIGVSRGLRGRPAEFEGKKYPTFVHFEKTGNLNYRQKTDIGSRVRVALESDADADYFDRIHSPGKWWIKDIYGKDVSGSWTRTGPDEGRIHFTTPLDSNGVPGDRLQYTIFIDDEAPNRIDPFENYLTLELENPSRSGPGTRSNHPPVHRYDPPKWNPVEKPEWNKHNFGEESALRIVRGDGESVQSYDFHVNVDNHYLRVFSQREGEDIEANRSVFGNALVLIGLALLREYDKGQTSVNSLDDEEGLSVEEYVSYVTSGMSAVLLPMLRGFVRDQADDTD